MLIKSTIYANEKTWDNIPVVLLCHRDTQTFVYKAKLYSELEQLAREELGLAQDAAVAFEISTLDICKGHNLRVGASAYEAMWPCLDILSVVTSTAHPVENHQPYTVGATTHVKIEDMEPDLAPRVGALPEGRQGHVQMTRGLATPALTPNPSFEDVIHPSKADTAGGTAPSNVGSDNEGPSDYITCEATPVAKRVREEIEQSEASNTDYDTNDETSDIAEGLANRPAYGSHVNSSRGKGPRIREPPQRESTNDFARVVPASADERSAAPEDTNEPSRQRVQFVKDESPIKLERKGSSDINTTGKAHKAAVNVHGRQPQPSGDDTRIQMFVISPSNEEVEFKVRRRYTIQKVLKSACQQFGLDIARAKLYLVNSTENDEGETETTLTICPRDETLEQCGIVTGSRLVIEMDGEEYDD